VLVRVLPIGYRHVLQRVTGRPAAVHALKHFRVVVERDLGVADLVVEDEKVGDNLLVTVQGVW
jgi:hypothetical protein